jgi:cytochrome c oxidase subunit I+III
VVFSAQRLFAAAPALARAFSPLLALAASFAAAGAGLQIAGFVDAGLEPKANAWSATVAALLGMGALHAVLLALCAAVLIARSLAGRLGPQSRATLDCVALFWHAATALMLATLAVVQLMPLV